MSESKIYSYLSKVGKASSSEIARAVLKVKRSPQKLCESVVRGIIGDDPRFELGSDGMWRISRRPAVEEVPLSQAAFVVVSILGVNTLFGTEIVEMGAVKVVGGKTESEISFLVDPGVALPPEFSASTGITGKLMEEATAMERALPAYLDFLGDGVIAGHRIGPMLGALSRKALKLGFEMDNEVLHIEKLAGKLLSGPRPKDLHGLAAELRIPFYEGPRRALAEARLAMEILLRLTEMAPRRGVHTLEDLLEFQYPEIEKVDFSAYRFDRDFIEGLPRSPGVYIMKDGDGQVLYVGKSRNLRSRVRSYFYNRESVPEKLRGILDEMRDISFEMTGSELGALLREFELIRLHSPKFNTQLEVHERAPEGGAGDVIIILPAADPGDLELFMLRGRELAGRLCVRRDGSNLGAAGELVERVYRSAEPPGGADPEESEIALRWFNANRDRVNFIEVDRASGTEDLLRLIRSYLSEEGPEKVYHI